MIFFFMPILIALTLIKTAKQIKDKNKLLSSIYFRVGVFIATTPLGLFVGVFAYDAPDSTNADFFKVFFSIEAIPFFILLISLARLYKS